MGLVIGVAVLSVSSFLMGRTWERLGTKTVASPRIDSQWHQLPSGWSRNVGPLTAFAMTQERRAYWWVSRNGRTIIEGPSSTIDMAKVEAEREARELSL